ncbi:UPF0271 protein [Gracilibacillus halotolerans]|uniref:5-oxoprolinase subunit A n=1 Tax=Gracilibacillus halotolerans TaxID=74386 RepID=A0A841RJW1_9BACI|nr:5-oxoprolinase subunit PxpA [Gracilibacillus halotolerans]MBB6512262.1 UPF0271 protein [Gracilibacillus halotolerans]
MDLNCDLGESYGAFRMGNDEAILPYVDSVNIACGYHAGDPTIMQTTVKLAKEHGVKIGAHPGFPDLHGFGRRNLQMSPQEIYDMVLYQLGALHAFTIVNETTIHHVKPHGALYNMAAVDYTVASAIANAVHDFNPTIILYGLAKSELIRAGKDVGLTTWNETFADRRYEEDGTLTSRNTNGAVIETEQEVIEQVRLLSQGRVKTITGNIISLETDTICVHGDNKNAVKLVQTIREMFN